MYINSNYDIVRKVDGTVIIVDKINGSTMEFPTDHPNIANAHEGYSNLLRMDKNERSLHDDIITNLITLLGNTPKVVDPKSEVAKGLANLIKFFTEFQFEPNFRFVNSLALALADTKKSAKSYITNYFELIDSPYAKDINAKINSAEFKMILDNLSAVAPTKTINERFKLYYGSQGTGKTTIAMQETNGKCMVCNSSMLPADLMEDFVFDNGKATFQPSALWRAMADGHAIVLDEINLLPFDSLRFLQTILDGKKEFLYKGNKVEIKDGFQVIGTMNLTVNGMTYGLPEPLVDRCKEMRKFSLSANDLLNAIV